MDRNIHHPPTPRRSLRRVITDWLLTESSRLDRMETDMAGTNEKTTAAFVEMDAQLDALEAGVRADDTNDAAQVQTRTQRLRALLAAVNPENPAAAPGEAGAVEPVPAEQVGPDLPVVGETLASGNDNTV